MQLTSRIITSVVLLCISVCNFNDAVAQKHRKQSLKPIVNDSITRIATRYADSLSLLTERFKGWKKENNDILSNPYFYPLFATSTFSSIPVRNAMELPAASDKEQNETECLLENIYKSLNYIYTTKPWYITHNESNSNDTKIEEIAKEVKPEVKLTEKAPVKDNDIHEDFSDNLNIIVHKPNFWKFKCDLSFKFMQNHVSDNWYQGGENNNSWLSKAYIEANYNNKQKVFWNNSLEMKLGFQTSESDKRHKFKANEDLIRMINKLGFQASKHWNYTIMLQSWTQFYRGYRSNDDKVYSDFMSPFQSDLSGGMEYKLNTKKFNLTANIAPATCKLKYVNRKSLTADFGVNANSHTKFELGSSVTIDYTWNIIKNVSWKSRIYYYTNYDRSLVEWENTFKLKINQYLSTELFLYPRFDDSARRNKKNSYLQFRELLSVGLDLFF